MASSKKNKPYQKKKVHPSAYNRQMEEMNRIARQEGRLYYAKALMAVSFFSVLLVMGILSVALPKPEVSEYERRELAKMPAFSLEGLFGGSYLHEVELFYADTFPFREGFVKAAALMDEGRGVRVDGVRIIDAAPPAVAEAPPVTAQEAPEPPQPEPQPAVSRPEEKPVEAPAEEESEVEESGPVEPAPAEPEASEASEGGEPAGEEEEDDGATGEQTSNGLFIYKNKAMAIFGGNKTQGDYYAKTLNAYASKVGENVTVYNLVIPTAIEFGLPEKYQSVSNSQLGAIEHIYGQLNNVTPVDAYSALESHAGEYVYFNTDHHWTGLGAYYAYTAFCQSAGLEALTLEDYEKRTLDGKFLGTLYSQTNDSKVKAGADQVDYYIVPGNFKVVRYERKAPNTAIESTVWAEFASGANMYSVYLHGDYPLVEMKTEAGTGRKAVVIKESFGNAFAPYLLAHYDEVYVVDQRYYNKGLLTLIKQKKIDDVIFINNAFAANTKSQITSIESMMY